MSIGKRIRKLRKAAGMSQEELADRVGKKRSSISKYESDSILPSIGALEALADALNVSASDLMDGNEEQGFDFSTPLTQDETELLNLYRNMPKFGKRHVLYLARNIHEEFSIDDNLDSFTIYGGDNEV